MRTILEISQLLHRLDHIISLFHPLLPHLERKLLSFTAKLAWLGIPLFSKLSGSKCNISHLVADHLCREIISKEIKTLKCNSQQ